MKLHEVLNPALLSAMYRLRTNKEIKASVAWKLLPADKLINETQSAFEKMRLELCKKYATKDEKGEAIIIQTGNAERFEIAPENQTVFETELKELTEQEIVMPVPTVKISDLGNVNITLEDLQVLVGNILVDG